MNPKVQIFIMSHNRPDYIKESVYSILAQDYNNYELVISDNSSDNRVEDLLKNEFPNIKCIIHRPMLSLYDHWNYIISKVNAPYFMMFHDDDILLPDAISKLVSALEQNPKAIAAAGNADLIRNGKLTTELFNKALHSTKIISSAYELGQHYFKPNSGIQAFPGYLYRTEMCRKNSFNSQEAGKHSDATFLMKCLRFGPIIWLTDVCLHYRYHQTNASMGFDIADIIGLTRFYGIETQTSNTDYFAQEFKVKNYILWMREFGFMKLKNKHPLRHKIIVKYILKFIALHPLRFSKIIVRNICRV